MDSFSFITLKNNKLAEKSGNECFRERPNLPQIDMKRGIDYRPHRYLVISCKKLCKKLPFRSLQNQTCKRTTGWAVVLWKERIFPQNKYKYGNQQRAGQTKAQVQVARQIELTWITSARANISPESRAHSFRHKPLWASQGTAASFLERSCGNKAGKEGKKACGNKINERVSQRPEISGSRWS